MNQLLVVGRMVRGWRRHLLLLGSCQRTRLNRGILCQDFVQTAALKHFHSLLLPCLLLACLSLSAPAFANATSTDARTADYYINQTSFDAIYGVSTANVLLRAIRSTTTSGGSSQAFHNSGTTNDTGCGLLAPNHVWASSVCPWWGCGDQGVWTPCPNGHWQITIYINGGTVRQPLALTTPTFFNGPDLDNTVSHEFIHAAGVGHIDTEVPCNMNGGSAPDAGVWPSINQRTFCESEMSAMWHTRGVGKILRAARPDYTTPPPTNPASWTELGTCTNFGIGMGDIQRGQLPGGAARDGMVIATTISSFHQPLVFDYDTFNCSNNQVTTSGMHRRPTLAYDPTRKRWWVFAHWSAMPNNVWVYVSSDFANWTPAGQLSDAVFGAASTREAVAATYDPISDQIIVALNDYTVRDVSACYANGCTGDLVVMRAAAGSSTPVTWTGRTRLHPSDPTSTTPGYRAVGPPALACESVAFSGKQCDLVFTANDSSRNLAGLKLGFDPVTKAFTGVSTPYYFGGAATPNPISITALQGGGGNPPQTALAITGMDDRIYVTWKTAGTNWTAPNYWQPFALITPSQKTYMGPILRGRNLSNWELYFAKWDR